VVLIHLYNVQKRRLQADLVQVHTYKLINNFIVCVNTETETRRAARRWSVVQSHMSPVWCILSRYVVLMPHLNCTLVYL